jgi:hypothetical protein
MPDQRSHGFPYQQPPRHDEEPAGVTVPEQAEAGAERRPDGTLALGASTVPSKGGKAHKGKTRLSHRVDGAPALDPVYVKQARSLRNALRTEIAAVLGGGVCGIAASLFVKFAAQKTAAAEQAFQAGDFETHRKLSESARMDILYAREHAAKEAAARPKAWVDPLAPYRLPEDDE